jgi:hypothetical protein
MFGGPDQRWQRIDAIAQKFREKGATSPSTAMTALDLGLPPRFEQRMQRRLGRTGIFVGVGGGRYYLNETRLTEVMQGQGSTRQYRSVRRTRGSILSLRIARMVIGVLILSLFLLNLLYGRIYDLWIVVAVLVVIWIGLSIYQIYYLSRLRSERFRGEYSP